jgi:hypothetical protein
MQSSTISLPTRNVNEMTAKLGGVQRTVEDDEVAQGLKPSATNKSKELS